MLKKIYYSLPVQLVILNLKRNRLILLLWVLLFAIIMGKLGKSYGIPYLFVDPEYMNRVSFWSLFVIGFAFGIFIMAYNITVYITESYRFQFLMIQDHPFQKFCLNNFVFPLALIVLFAARFIIFQLGPGQQEWGEILKELLGFTTGLAITIILTMAYFTLTGYRLFRNFTQSLNEKLHTEKISRVQVIQKIKMIKRKSYHIDYYLNLPFKFEKVEGFIPYDKMLMTKIIDRNHMNAILLQGTGFIMILLLGYFRDNVYFQIPAGASILILISIIIMFMGAFGFWLKGWAMYFIIAFVIIVNYAIQFDFVNPDYQVFGLNYDTKPAVYSFERISKLSSRKNYRNDHNHTLQMLEKWKSKFDTATKPKMVLICTSGGGQRAAMWTVRTLQVADSIVNGALMKNTFCITGASGGIIGASYYRELYRRKQLKENITLTDSRYLDNISKDILNPVAFSMIVNDLFFRFERFSVGKYSYIKDRGYAFERVLSRNTEGILDLKVMDYKKDEEESVIPMLLLTPSIVNDGRKLYVSPQPVSYMNSTEIENDDLLRSKVKGIEFMRFYKEQDAENLSFLSGLRMSATFPYITPNINLPSSPSMEVMDAGLTDNYGIIDAVRFTFIFRDWIKNNTSGVIFMCVRDSPKLIPIDKKSKPTLMDKIFNPISTLYANWDWIQDNNDEYFLEYANSFLTIPVDVLEFQYSPMPNGYKSKDASQKEINDMILDTWKSRASLNWHLTKKEKESLKSTIYNDYNKKALETLHTLILEPGI